MGFGGIRSHHDTSLVQIPDEIESRYKFVKSRRIKIINSTLKIQRIKDLARKSKLVTKIVFFGFLKGKGINRI